MDNYLAELIGVSKCTCEEFCIDGVDQHLGRS